MSVLTPNEAQAIEAERDRLWNGIKRYESTKKASPELRQYMRDRLFNPGPLTDAELVDFAAYLEKQGVAVHWVRLDGFSTDRDMSPYSWTWREARGEIKERATLAPAPASAPGHGGTG